MTDLINLIRPSAAVQWMTCPASIRMSADIPDMPSPAAEEGTFAHAVGERCLTEGIDARQVEGVTREMAEFVQQYVDLVRSEAAGGRLFIEQRIKLDPYIPTRVGTADAVIVKEEALHIIDLKYGRGRVLAEQNPQLMIYALGAYTALSRSMVISKVKVTICQPRLDHIDTWSIDVADLVEFGDKVKAAVDDCLQPDSAFNPDEKACQWCRARSTCPALYAKTVEVIGQDFSNEEVIELPAPKALSTAQLAAVVKYRALISKWFDSVEAYVLAQMEHGEAFDGLKLVEGRTVRKWSTEAETALVDLLGNFAYEKKLIGIGAAEKLLGKKKIYDLGITHKPAGRPTVVPEDDNRDALTALADFDHVE